MGVFRNLNSSWFGGGFHPRGKVYGIPLRGIFHSQIRTDLPNNHQTGIDPHAHVELQPPLVAHFIAVGANLVQDVQPCEHRALGIIFMCDGCAKKSQDAITHQPRQSAFIAVYGGDQVLKGAIHNLRPIFRIELLCSLCGALDIAKKHADDSPLARYAASSASCFEFREQFWGDKTLQRSFFDLGFGGQAIMP